MPFTHFRYIAYQVPTVADNGQVKYGIPPGVVANPPQLYGPVANLSADSRVRLERLFGAFALALNGVAQAGDNVRTLKIFVLPEFYFRPDNAETAYTLDEYRAIKQVLRTTVSTFDRPDWLFIPGTILWKQNLPSIKRPIFYHGDQVFFNSSVPVRSLGLFGVDSRMVEKQEASGIDGLPTGSHGVVAAGPRNFSTDQYWGAYYGSFYKRQKHLFRAENVDIGLEICLEHGLQTLRKTFGELRWYYPQYIVAYLSLHILTAGGMSINPRSVCARPGGYVLRNDGYTRGQVNFSELSRVTGYRYLPNWDLEADLQNVPMQYSIPFGAGHSLYLPPPPGYEASWANHPQGLNLFPVQQLV